MEHNTGKDESHSPAKTKTCDKASPVLRLRARLVVPVIVLGAILFSISCKGKDEKDPPSPEPPASENEPVAVAFLPSSRLSVDGDSVVRLSPAELASGGLKAPVDLTYSLLETGADAFAAGLPSAAKVPFIAIGVEKGTEVAITHRKMQGAAVARSSQVVPVRCSEAFLSSLQETVSALNAKQAGPALGSLLSKLDGGAKGLLSSNVICIPLTNSGIRGLVKPADSGVAYTEELRVDAKKSGRRPSSAKTRFTIRVIVPKAPVKVEPTLELSSLSLRERHAMFLSDVKNTPRRDFPAFQLTTAQGPGVKSSWLLSFSNLRVDIEQEVFFENPVVPPGSRYEPPSVSRGYKFLKKDRIINSRDHFRLTLVDGYDQTRFFNVAPAQALNVFEVPISDATSPLFVKILPDFGSERASRVLSEYYRPLGPVFCPTQELTFRPIEWIASALRGSSGPASSAEDVLQQTKKRTDFIECEARRRARYRSAEEARAAGATNAKDSFLGSYNYAPLGAPVSRPEGEPVASLGGTVGVLSMRVSVSGTLEVQVRNPQKPDELSMIAKTPVVYSHLFPTVFEEMEEDLRLGKAPAGLDAIVSAMRKKGFEETSKAFRGSSGSGTLH